MPKLGDYPFYIGKDQYQPLMIGGMGVDISTASLALEACRLGAIGHISDAMVPFVSDRNFGTSFSHTKSHKYSDLKDSTDKSLIKFDLDELYKAQTNHVTDVMRRKKGRGAIFINVMEKLTMGAPGPTLKTRLDAALDSGIDGITLSAGLHQHSLKLIAENPRFREAKIGIIVSSDRALKIFLRAAAKIGRLPDYVVVEGPLAGGHLGFGLDWEQHSLSNIVTAVKELLTSEDISIPIIAAGGIFTGEDATNILNFGASAVQVATRFTVTEECGLPAHVKQAYFQANKDDVVVNTVSPTGYPMRMLAYSPCLQSNIKPNCHAFGYMLDQNGQCQYINAYEATSVNESGKKLIVKDKICLCYHFSKFNCYTCGQYVYRLKDTSQKERDGSYKLLRAEDVINDYLLVGR